MNGGFTEGAVGALDFGTDFLAGVDVFDDDFFKSGEVFVSLDGERGTSLRRLLNP